MQLDGLNLDTRMELDATHAEIVGIKPRVKKPKFIQAVDLEQEGKLPDAEKLYIELLDEDFGNVTVLAALGMNYAVQNKHGLSNCILSAALDAFDDRFEKDIEAVGIILKEGQKGGRAKFLAMKKSEIMNAIGTNWKHENKTDKARYWFERAQKILPSPNPDIQNNLATLHINEGSPDKAIEHLDLAISINKDHAQAHWNRSLARLELGDYGGFDEYHWGKRAEVRMNRNYSTSEIPDWDGTPGKTVIVYGEQGIGDEIMFASLLPEMIRDCKQVVFDCHKKLHRLFANSFPMIDIYPTREDENITWPLLQVEGKTVNRYPVDAKLAIGDVPKFYRRKIEDFPGFPYIRPTPKAATKWATKMNEIFLDDKPVVVINWIGGHKKTRVEVRSMRLEQWLPILKLDAHFVSLQYTKCEDELDAFAREHGISIHHFAEAAYSDHYDEVAGVLANADLVITCCSSIVHLAGSMGVPTWVLTPSRPAWRYRLDLSYMPWYGKTVTLFRQSTGSVAWEPVIEDVAGSLNELIETTRNAENRNPESLTGSHAPRTETENSCAVSAGVDEDNAG